MNATTKTRLNITDGLSGQFRIDSAPYDGPGTWEECYINFIGYFGSIGPHVFAAAPELLKAAEGLGAMPEGYCFCSKDRIGDDSKTHEPECADMRAAIAKAKGAAS